MEKDSRIFVAGANNITGISLLHYFKANGFTRTMTETDYSLNLLDQAAVFSFLQQEKPEYVFLTHVKSGGIVANNSYPAEFIYTNLQIQNNIIHGSYVNGVKKLLFFASSCVYPVSCPQPMKEEYFLTAPMEKISEPYSIAKAAGIKMCDAYRKQYGVNFISCIPATSYGSYDHFDTESSHVLSALMHKFHEAKKRNEDKAIVWGSGAPRREFIYSFDLVDAAIFLMDRYNQDGHMNIGVGSDVSISELAGIIKEIVCFKGEIIFDRTKPDGAFQKLLDNKKMLSLGWEPKVSLRDGISQTYKWFLSHRAG